MVSPSDVNMDLGFKAKVKDLDFGFKTETNDIEFKAKV